MTDDTTQSGIWTNPDGVATSKADDVIAQKNAERDAESVLPDQKEQIAALKTELERLRESVQQIASGTRQIASAEFKELTSAAEERLKQNVFLSVGIAAVVGYLWGRSGR